MLIIDMSGLQNYVGTVSEPFKSNKPASHALVFILRGVAVSWKQTVAYYFTGDSTPGAQLWEVSYFAPGRYAWHCTVLAHNHLALFRGV
jgi:hypothetical protein